MDALRQRGRGAVRLAVRSLPGPRDAERPGDRRALIGGGRRTAGISAAAASIAGRTAAALAAQMALAAAARSSAGSVEKGVYRLRGDVRINGMPAKEGMDVKAGDVITTGRGSEVGVRHRQGRVPDPRELARARAQGVARRAGRHGLRVVTGAVLSVFAPGERKTLRTATATIGIRGTGGLPWKPSEARTYVCTCYGEAEIVSAADPSARETVRTTQHEQPRYVMGTGAPQMLMGAPVVNHDRRGTDHAGEPGRAPAAVPSTCPATSRALLAAFRSAFSCSRSLASVDLEIRPAGRVSCSTTLAGARSTNDALPSLACAFGISPSRRAISLPRRSRSAADVHFDLEREAQVGPRDRRPASLSVADLSYARRSEMPCE